MSMKVYTFMNSHVKDNILSFRFKDNDLAKIILIKLAILHMPAFFLAMIKIGVKEQEEN